MSINKVSHYLLTEHTRDAVRELEQFEPEQLAEYLDAFPIDIVADVLKYMVPSIAADVLKHMAIEKSSKIVMQLGIERGALLLRRLAANMRLDFVSHMPSVFANMMRLVLRYPEGTVGHAMNPNVLTVQEELTVEEVLHVIKNSAHILKNDIYIIDNKQHLVGRVAVRNLLISASDLKMKQLMEMTGHTLAARASLRSVKGLPDWQQHENFPVIDHHNMFIGVLERQALSEVVKVDSKEQAESELTGAALTVAELFWEACTNLVVPNQTLSNKANNHE